jgi:hypothetical protein
MNSRKEQSDFSRQKDTSSPGANHNPWNTEVGAKYLETGLKAGIFNPVRDEHIGGMSFLKGFEITNNAGDSKSTSSQEVSNASETSSKPKPNDDIAARTNAELLTNKQLTKGWDGATPSQGDVIRHIGNSQVGFWGDDHSDPKSVEHLNESLATLKNAGVSTVAIEGLDRNGQNLARSWLAAPNGSETANELESKIRSYLKQAQPDGDRPSVETVKTNQLWRDKTFGLLQGLKTTGLNVLGLEPDITSKSFDAEQDKNWHGNVKTFLAEHSGEKLLIFSGALHFTSTNHSFKDRMNAEHINVVDLTPPSQYKPLEPQ